MEWTVFTIKRNGKLQDVEILYSLDPDEYEGKIWVDIHKVVPHDVVLTSQEIRDFCEQV